MDFQKDCPFLRKTVPTPDGQRHIFPCIHGTPTAGNMGLFQPDLPGAQPRYSAPDPSGGQDKSWTRRLITVCLPFANLQVPCRIRNNLHKAGELKTNPDNQFQSPNSNLYSAFSQSLSSQSQQLSLLTKKQLNLSIINFFNQNIHNNTSNSKYYSVIEKSSKTPYKEYEISYINSNGESTVKSYRRFDNFLDFHKKIKLKYPYIIIPSLPKNN